MQNKGDNYLHHIKAGKDVLAFLDSRLEFSELRHNFERYFFYWLQEDVGNLDKGVPGLQKKKEVLDAYLLIFNAVPKASLEVMPKRFKDALAYMKTGKTEQAWQLLVDVEGGAAVNKNKSDEIEVLKAGLNAVYSSKSWYLTSVPRKIVRKIKGCCKSQSI